MNEREAHAIVDQAWRNVHGRSPSALESLYAQAIARLETGYGRAGQFAAMAARGQFNWGALERRPGSDGACPAGTAPGRDQGDVCFFVFPSDVAAATEFVRNLTGPLGRLAARNVGIVRAMRGSPEDVARAMRVSPAYYAGFASTEEGKVTAYATAIRRSSDAIAAGGVPVPALTGGGSKTTAILLGLGLLGAAGYVYAYGVPRIVTRALAR